MAKKKFERDLNTRRWKNYSPAGNDLSANLSNDVTNTTTVLNVAAEAHTLAVGAQGTTGVIRIADNAPIYDSVGANVADYTDTSLVVTGTALTTEVEYKHELSDAEQLAELNDGEYAVDYIWGKMRYCKDDASTAITVDYTTRQMNVLTSGTSPTVTANVNLNQIAGASTAVNSGDVTNGTQRVAIATDDVNLAAINTATTSLETKDFATETTLLNADATLTTISGIDFATETTLSSIDANIGDVLTSVEATETLITDVVDTSSNLVRVTEQDPLPYHFMYGVLADVTNGTDGTYEYYINMDTVKELGIEFILDGGSGTVTATIEGTLQDDGTAPADCTYQDVSTLWGASSWTSSDILVDGDKIAGQFKYLKIKIVAATGGANDADWLARFKKLY